MSLRAVATRYADALFFLTTKDNIGDTLECLTAVKDLFSLDDASRILLSPVMPKQLKNDLIKYALDQVGTKNSDVRRFFEVVVDSDRVEAIPHIEEAFHLLSDKANGIERADLVLASELGQLELDNLKDLAEAKFNTKLTIQTSVNKHLLGGFILNVGNKQIDLSLKSKLEELTLTAAH